MFAPVGEAISLPRAAGCRPYSIKNFCKNKYVFSMFAPVGDDVSTSCPQNVKNFCKNKSLSSVFAQKLPSGREVSPKVTIGAHESKNIYQW